MYSLLLSAAIVAQISGNESLKRFVAAGPVAHQAYRDALLIDGWESDLFSIAETSIPGAEGC